MQSHASSRRKRNSSKSRGSPISICGRPPVQLSGVAPKWAKSQYRNQALAKHFSAQQTTEICLNVGLAQITNRFNATFFTEVDDYIVDANEKATRTAASCPVHS
jgi:hypothetical protein